MFSEVEGNCKTPDQETQNYRLNHTMIRVKDPAKSVDFYTRIMGMKLLRKIDFPAAKFSLYFLGSFDEKEVKDIPETDDETIYKTNEMATFPFRPRVWITCLATSDFKRSTVLVHVYKRFCSRQDAKRYIRNGFRAGLGPEMRSMFYLIRVQPSMAEDI